MWMTAWKSTPPTRAHRQAGSDAAYRFSGTASKSACWARKRASCSAGICVTTGAVIASKTGDR